ncbi:unnamed protein product [Chrysoparadoxa australica]
MNNPPPSGHVFTSSRPRPSGKLAKALQRKRQEQIKKRVQRQVQQDKQLQGEGEEGKRHSLEAKDRWVPSRAAFMLRTLCSPSLCLLIHREDLPKRLKKGPRSSFLAATATEVKLIEAELAKATGTKGQLHWLLKLMDRKSGKEKREKEDEEKGKNS